MSSSTTGKYKERIRQVGKLTKGRFENSFLQKDEAKKYCYQTLEKVSRSFAVVIQDLNPKLKDGVCIYYLVLRALDSIEDDLNTPLGLRIKLLHQLPENLSNEDYKLVDIGDKPEYKVLLENYGKVAKCYNELPQSYKVIIKETANKMGQGMAYYSQTPIENIHDYNEYCHYVAGLVGIGLSELFSASGLESNILSKKWKNSNDMGLFLQKTNITKDFAEDIDSGRFFWPQEIWEKYCEAPIELQRKASSTESLNCLNHMVLNAMEHFDECIEYLMLLKDPTVFRFCAIPQLMALATLSKVYNNSSVFTQNVKISRGESSKIFLDCNNMDCFISMSMRIIEQWNIKSDSEIDQSLKELLNNLLKKYKSIED